MNPLTIRLEDFDHVWRTPIFFGMLFFILLLSWKFLRKLGPWMLAAWLYVVIYALYIVEFPGFPFGLYNTAFQATAGQTLVELLLIPTAILLTTSYTLKNILLCIVSFEIISVWARGYGLMGAPSFDTALIACFVPFCPVWLMGISIGTIVTHHGSTALLILLAQLLGFSIKEKGARIPLLLLIPVALAVAFAHQNNAWFDSVDRLDHYKRYMATWWDQNWFIRAFGFGPGSFIWLGMMKDNYKEPVFFQMHSDFLQIIFELGIIGFSTIAALTVKAYKSAAQSPQLISAIFGCVAFSLTYHPLRFFPSMIMVGFIMKEALYPQKHSA